MVLDTAVAPLMNNPTTFTAAVVDEPVNTNESMILPEIVVPAALVLTVPIPIIELLLDEAVVWEALLRLRMAFPVIPPLILAVVVPI